MLQATIRCPEAVAHRLRPNSYRPENDLGELNFIYDDSMLQGEDEEDIIPVAAPQPSAPEQQEVSAIGQVHYVHSCALKTVAEGLGKKERK